MFEQTFKNIDNILKADGGAVGELGYLEQTSWIIFLKYLDDLEKERDEASKLSGTTYTKILDEKFTWKEWAAPKLNDGSPDHNKGLTGNDLIEFVNQELFPYLSKFKAEISNLNSVHYKIGEIFSDLKNKFQSGYNLKEVINLVDSLSFKSTEEKHQMTSLYEEKIKVMGNAGRDGGALYTPRPLIKCIVEIINPKLGETIYDGAVGSAGFLSESYEYLKSSNKLSSKEKVFLENSTFFGKEKEPLAYMIANMNLILHGINSPNIIHTNTLNENIRNISQKDQYDIILANPPFAGNERNEVQQNFPIKTSETAYLFLQHFIKSLKVGGRAGIVIKNTFLLNADAKNLRKELFETCDVHTILDLPKKVFTAGVTTIVLFFTKGKPTKNIWFYQLSLNRNLGKTNPLNNDDLSDFSECYKTKSNSENSWVVSINDINKETWDLTPNNPNRKVESDERTPKEILQQIQELDNQASNALNAIKNLL
ncbi:N-6 DNA methylase [Methylophilaceae bacterium]|nr:N-6 DNA methylase [Methylophilaceae bacterium]